MAWVPIRVNLGGDGYTELLNHQDGAAHFGAWIGIIEVGATCEPRGALVRGNGKPHDAESLARITRIPVEILQTAIPRLVSIGWLQYEDAESAQCAEGILQDTVARQRKFVATDSTDITLQTEQSCATTDAVAPVGYVSPVNLKKTKPLRDSLTPQQESWFSAFWDAYWFRKARKPAQNAFAKACKTAERFAEIMAAVEAQKAEMLAREASKRPHAATWLNQERWNDEASQPAQANAVTQAMKLLYPEGTA